MAVWRTSRSPSNLMNLQGNRALGSLRTWVRWPCRVVIGTPRWPKLCGKPVGPWMAWLQSAQLLSGVLTILWMGRSVCLLSKWQIWQGDLAVYEGKRLLIWEMKGIYYIYSFHKSWKLVVFQNKNWIILCVILGWCSCMLTVPLCFPEFVQTPCEGSRASWLLLLRDFFSTGHQRCYKRGLWVFCWVEHWNNCAQFLASYVIFTWWRSEGMSGGKIHPYNLHCCMFVGLQFC